MSTLKYLFTAVFNDGSYLDQNVADVSATDQTKSCFYDVQERINDVVSFGLIDDDENHACVNLDTGEFIINGSYFTLSALLPDTKRELVYWRRHTHQFANGHEQAHDVEYIIGYKANGIDYTIAVQ
jgi:hypothetical protein